MVCELEIMRQDMAWLIRNWLVDTERPRLAVTNDRYGDVDAINVLFHERVSVLVPKPFDDSFRTSPACLQIVGTDAFGRRAKAVLDEVWSFERRRVERRNSPLIGCSEWNRDR